MKKQGILNPELSRAIAELGHNHMICIGDAGLPIPEHVERIDLALIKDVPLVKQVLDALEAEVAVQEVILARETDEVSPQISSKVADLWPDAKSTRVSHEELKQLMNDCRFVIRTGEFTPYANVILVSGVPF